MEVSYHPSLAGRYPLAWEERIQIAAAAGFKRVDLNMHELAGTDPNAVRETLAEAGVAAGAASLPAELRADDGAFEESLGFLREVAPLAAGVGIRVMHRSLPASSDTPQRELETRLRRRWKECAAILGEHGVVAAVEPLGTPYRRREGAYMFIGRLDSAAEFAASCGVGVGLLLDSWHWHLSGDSAGDILAARELIAHVHVADVPSRRSAASLRDDERVLPEDGVVDFEDFADALAEAKYDGLIAPEVPGSWSARLSPREAARRGLEATLAVLDRRGGGGGTCSDVERLKADRSCPARPPRFRGG